MVICEHNYVISFVIHTTRFNFILLRENNIKTTHFRNQLIVHCERNSVERLDAKIEYERNKNVL